MEVLAARFPVFDVQKNVYGYELSYEGSLDNYYQIVKVEKKDTDLSAFIRLADMLGSKKGFVDFSYQQLISQFPLLFDRDTIVICLKADMQVDPDVIEICSDFKHQGYQLALNDFTEEHFSNPLLRLVDLVMVDFQAMDSEVRQKLCRKCSDCCVAVYGRNLESEEHFNQARGEGFLLFGGEFFTRPTVKPQSDAIAPNKVVALQLLNEANQPDLSLEEIAKLIQRDVGLTYTLLQLVNSIWFGLRHKVMSIQHALILLGPREVQRWASMVALYSVGSDKPGALLELALMRARFAESLALLKGMKSQCQELFLLGMFSVVDAILDRPLENILNDVALGDNIKQALLNNKGPYAVLYKTMLAYEHGLWVLFSDLAAEQKIDVNAIPQLHRSALDWSQKACSTVGAARATA